VGAQKECGGAETFRGPFSDVGDCARACKGVATMFAFGTNEFGDPRCNTDGCSCYCETSARGGNCNVESHNGYRLYKYGKYQVFRR
jgi:hypothetical protein